MKKYLPLPIGLALVVIGIAFLGRLDGTPGASSLAEKAKTCAASAAAKLPHDAALVADAHKLAAVYKAQADQIGESLDSIEKLIRATRYAKETALGSARSAVWKPWTTEVGQWLDEQRAKGAIKDVADCKAIWVAISDGLATVHGARSIQEN